MLINGKFRCAGCMNELNDEFAVCSCGFNNNTDDNLSHCLQIGTVLNDAYIVGKVIGEGGFGITYVGWDKDLEKKVAIKEFYMDGFTSRNSTVSSEVNSKVGDDEELFAIHREKFVNEAKVLASFMEEPGIVTVHKFFRENNTAYIVMEYVEGITLKSYLKNKGKLSVDETIGIIGPIMNSLTKIHEKNLIHRDISPDNIMITADGRGKLIDFGAAREANNGNKSLSVVLKHGFAPMEQYQTHGNQGPWTDVYALSATIYRCITGVVPAEAPDRIMDDKLQDVYKIELSCSREVSAVISKGLELRYENRYQSVGELKKALMFSLNQKKNTNESKKPNIAKQAPVRDNGTNGTNNKRRGRDKKKTRISLVITTAILLLVIVVGLICINTVKKNNKIEAWKEQATTKVIAAGNSVDSEFEKCEKQLFEFAGNQIVIDCLKYPDDEELAQKAYDYTVEYYSKLYSWEAIYIADWNSKVLAHPAAPVIGRVMREGDRLTELQNAMTSSDGVYNAGIIVSAASGEFTTSMYVPVYDTDGITPLGYVGGGVYVTDIVGYYAYDDLFEMGSSAALMYFVDSTGTMLYHLDESKIGNPVENEAVKGLVAKIEAGEHPTPECVEYVYKGVKKYAAYYVGKDEAYIAVLTADENNVLAGD